MTYQNVNIDTDVEIDIDADEIVNDASDAVVQIMNDNLDIEGEIANTIDGMDLSEAIRGTLKMNPALVIGAIVEYARKESALEVEVARLRHRSDSLEAELLIRGARIESLTTEGNKLRDEMEQVHRDDAKRN